MTMRHDAELDAECVILRGLFYESDGSTWPATCVVKAHGRTATRRLYLDRFAEVFAAAGMRGGVGQPGLRGPTLDEIVVIDVETIV